jgi:hypothetical protein
MIPNRVCIELGVGAAIVAGFLWYRHSLIVEGENIKAIAQQEAANEQAGKDAVTSKETVDGLKAEIAFLREHADQPPVVRLCSTPSRVRAPPATSGAPTGPTPTADVPVVSEGTGSGVNVGPGLLEFAEAADIMSARDRACLAWARGIAK